MTKGKKILLISGAVLGSLVFLGYRKFDQAKEVISNLEFQIKKLSNVKIGLSRISFDAVISLVNPTNINFGATATSFIMIKEIRVYSQKNQLLGKAESSIYKIDLPANSVMDLPNIRFNLTTMKALEELLTNSESYFNHDFSNLKYQIDVEAFGNIYTLNA